MGKGQYYKRSSRCHVVKVAESLYPVTVSYCSSFLLEVTEYIQFSQEKVHKHEGSYQVWNQEKEKLTSWRNNQRPSESYDDQSRVINSGFGPSSISLFPSKIEEENFSISPTITGGHNMI